jgi:signal transduction histidine kinase
MENETRVSQALLGMARISNQSDLAYSDKLQLILEEVVGCMDAAKGSIMIGRDDEYLEVVAATDVHLIGIRQPISEKAPASYVFLDRAPLYMDGSHHEGPVFRAGQGHYKKDAFLIVPLMAGKKALGVLSLTEKSGEDRFSEAERELVVSFASQVIGAAENYRLNSELLQKQRCLQESHQRLQSMEKLRAELFNMLVHDLKGPISEIMANIDILSYMAEGEMLEYVKTAQAGCDTLYRMIADLMDIAQLEEGCMTLTPESISPRDLLSDAVSMIHSIARTRGVRMEPDPSLPEDPESGTRFYGDRAMLLRVLQNLLINAIQFSPENERIEVGYAIEPYGTVRFSVKDYGPGIAPEFQTAVFDKFFQVKKRNDGRIYSKGLGLAFCKLAIELHGGRIGIESDGKFGSTFWMTLPLEPGA